ncbi:hypothetical protein PM082_019103 [Marasmius tenuissimus]|nr:hypothetical protein PM082_019103 [Marasmius tenuissimus]
MPVVAGARAAGSCHGVPEIVFNGSLIWYFGRLYGIAAFLPLGLPSSCLYGELVFTRLNIPSPCQSISPSGAASAVGPIDTLGRLMGQEVTEAPNLLTFWSRDSMWYPLIRLYSVSSQPLI